MKNSFGTQFEEKLVQLANSCRTGDEYLSEGQFYLSLALVRTLLYLSVYLSDGDAKGVVDDMLKYVSPQMVIAAKRAYSMCPDFD